MSMQKLPIIVPHGLFERVMTRISREQRLYLWRRIIVSCAACIALFAACVPVWRALVAELGESGFFQYATLLVSDFKSVAALWQDYALTLLESLPAARLTEFLVLALLLVVAIFYSLNYSSALNKVSYAR